MYFSTRLTLPVELTEFATGYMYNQGIDAVDLSPPSRLVIVSGGFDNYFSCRALFIQNGMNHVPNRNNLDGQSCCITAELSSGQAIRLD